MKSVRFHPEAEAEMIDVAAWYEAQQAGLGKRFLACVQEALNRIQLKPGLYAVVEQDVRRCLIKVFPFGLPRIRPETTNKKKESTRGIVFLMSCERS